MPADQFNDLTEVYDAMFDWPRRLANEEPFYRRIFEQVIARRVVDVACGTGRHAAMFHSWGLDVEGADSSPKMIEQARSRLGENDKLKWVVRGFDQPIASAPFDVAICVGNSLALAPDKVTVERAVREMLAAVRTGGAVVMHLMNLWRLADGPCVWQTCKRVKLSAGDALIVKGVHRSGTRGYVELIVSVLDSGAAMRSEAVPFLGLEAENLRCMANAAGAARVEVYGNFKGEQYERERSADLIVIARK